MPNQNNPETAPDDREPLEGLLNPEDHENPVEHPTSQDELSESELDVDAEVDDIVEKESDQVLAAEDAEVAKAFEASKHETRKEKLVRLFHQWWDNKRLRYATFASLGVFMLLVGLVPPSRYFVLNTVGVRSRASIVVLDDSTDRPLKNVQVTIGQQTTKTDSQGKASFSGVKLGRHQLSVDKRAFATSKKFITIGWGSNPLGQVQIKPVGAQYIFYATDWLSGKPIPKAEASSGDFDATADEDGKIVLTIDASDDEDLDITIRAEDYRDEVIKLDLANKAQLETKLVAKRKAAFVSKRSGKYDLYKIDVDGKNEELALAGTGNESDKITLLVHPTSEVAALVSTRDNVRNKDGYLLSTLTVIDLEDNSIESVVQSEDIRLLGWSGDRLVFGQVAAGASAPNAKRQRLVSYEYQSNEKKELASSNSFNSYVLIDDTVYYAPSNPYNPSATSSVYSQKVDGTAKTAILDKDTWTIFRNSYNELIMSVDQSWYGFKLGDKKATRRSGVPNNVQDRSYITSPNGKVSLWTEERDGKSTLLLYDVAEDSDKVLKSQAGLQSPIRWLNNTTLIYRIQTPGESADYVMSVNGGEAKKIRDVTRTIDMWH